MVEYCLYKADIKDPDGAGWFTNGEWVDSIDRTYNTITPRSIIKNVKQLLKQNNCPSGCYNIDIIRGPQRIVQDCDFYECCTGYANIRYDCQQNKVLLVNWKIEQ